MVLKLLPDFPEDVIYRAAYYRFWEKIELCKATQSEVDLLNRINAHHSSWAYSRQPFTASTELVSASDFLRFFEHLRLHHKAQSLPLTSSKESPQAKSQPLETRARLRPTASDKEATNGHRHLLASSSRIIANPRPRIAPSITYPPNSAISSPPASLARLARPSRPSAPFIGPTEFSQPVMPTAPPSVASRLQVPTSIAQTPVLEPRIEAFSSVNHLDTADSGCRPNFAPSNSEVGICLGRIATEIAATSTVLKDTQAHHSTSQSHTFTSEFSNSPNLSATFNTSILPSTDVPAPATSAVPAANPVAPVPNGPTLQRGWLQINKLYTPYVSNTSENRHLYRIPISLLTFYQLLRLSSTDIDPNEPAESLLFTPQEQSLATLQEIDTINELCLKQNIKPFSHDMRLIDLTTFYHYCLASHVFVKELSMNDPKGSICKNWAAVTQTNGGLCRLRNTITLNERTVPFIGHRILNELVLSPPTLSTASLTTPDETEIEFLQLMLFYINEPTELLNPKLIDIESVKKEYTVDFTLLYNDKFHINVLKYQRKDNQNDSQSAAITRSNSTTTNPITESTPPPSPPSQMSNLVQHVASTTTESSSPSPTASVPTSFTSVSPIPANRFQKMITFRGHSLVAFVCSGLDMTHPRECVSIRDLCHALYPEAENSERIEKKMFRLLRIKNINRFRPQNQPSGNVTRLVDIKDIEVHWDFIEQGLRPASESNLLLRSTALLRTPKLSCSDEAPIKPIATASTSEEANIPSSNDHVIEKMEHASPECEMSPKTNHGSMKRFLDESIDYETENKTELSFDHTDKRIRSSDIEEFGSIISEESNFQHLSEDEVESRGKEQTGTIACYDEENKKPVRCRFDSNGENKLQTSGIRRKTKANVKPACTKRGRIRVVRRKRTTQESLDKIDRTTTSSNSGTTKVPKKRIFFAKARQQTARKRLTPCTRSNQTIAAAWVHKYNIEECWVRLDLCKIPNEDLQS